jgi:3-oxoacyl-[acyl-carrier protein] reductase
MAQNTDELRGQVALITGGAGGLGQNSALWLGRRGAHVILADLDGQRAEDAAKELSQLGLSTAGMALDVTDSGAVRALVSSIVAEHSRLDILLTSHGFPRDKRLLDMSDGQWDEVIRVCLTGTFFCIREAAKPMIEQNYGRIVTISSRAWHGNPGQANYSAAKAGVVGLTRSVAKELGRYSITANAIAPGLVDTASLQALPTYATISERALKNNSIRRLGTPDDVSAAVCYLASPDSAFVTGEVVHVSGGRFS